MTNSDPAAGGQPPEFPPSDMPVTGRQPQWTIYGGTTDQLAAALERDFFKNLGRDLPKTGDPLTSESEHEASFYTDAQPPTSANIAEAAEESPVEGSLAGILAKRMASTLMSSVRDTVERFLRPLG